MNMKTEPENDINSLRDHVVNLNHIDIGEIYSDAKDMRKYGFSFSESKSFCLDENNYKDYISTWESYQPRLQDDKYFLVSDDKMLFSMVFQNLVEVPEVWGIINNGNLFSVNNSGITNENIYDFFLRNNGGVIKYRSGCDGFGINMFNEKNGELYNNKTNKVISKDEFDAIVSDAKYCLVQKTLKQGVFENELFDKTINTIRIISIRKKDTYEHEIIGALQRIGTSKSVPVDNFNQGGGSAIIDVETGIMGSMTFSNSFDSNGKRLFYDFHPDTKAKIKGAKIPNWDKVKEKIVKISREIPFFEFVAWDVVLNDDDIALIEINMKSSLNIFQVHGGMRNELLGKKYRDHGWLVDDEFFK